MWQGPWHCFPQSPAEWADGRLESQGCSCSGGVPEQVSSAACKIATSHHLQHVRSVQCMQAELLAEEAAERTKAEAKAADKAAKKQAKAAKGESDRSGMCI